MWIVGGQQRYYSMWHVMIRIYVVKTFKMLLLKNESYNYFTKQQVMFLNISNCPNSCAHTSTSIRGEHVFAQDLWVLWCGLLSPCFSTPLQHWLTSDHNMSLTLKRHIGDVCVYTSYKKGENPKIVVTCLAFISI